MASGASTGPEPIRSRKGLFYTPRNRPNLAKKSFVLAMQRLHASARALASDGRSASITEHLHEAEEDHATIRNVYDRQPLRFSVRRSPRQTHQVSDHRRGGVTGSAQTMLPGMTRWAQDGFPTS